MLKQAKELLRRAHVGGLITPAVRLYSTVFPPPYRQANMEFDYGLWYGICTFHSQNGRQLGENNTDPDVYKEEVETEHQICTFEGTRKGLPINVTALRHVMALWEDSLQFTTLIRNDYIKRRRLDGTRLNLRQAYVCSKTGAAYAAYLARRKDDPIKSLPLLESAYFTLSIGMSMVILALMKKGDLRVLSAEPQSAEALYEMADSSHALVSSAGKGCAGNKKLILEYLDVQMNGTYKKALSSLEAKRAVDRVGDWDRFYDYLYASSRLDLLVKLNQQLCAQSLLALRSDPGQLSQAELGLVDKSLASSHGKAPDGLDDGTVMSNFIRIVLALLDEVDYHSLSVALTDAGMIGIDGAGGGAKGVSGGGLRKAAAKRMRLAFDLIYPSCRKELDDVHRTLGRFESNHLSMDDLYARCCGKGFRTLLKMLENG